MYAQNLVWISFLLISRLNNVCAKISAVDGAYYIHCFRGVFLNLFKCLKRLFDFLKYNFFMERMFI